MLSAAQGQVPNYSAIVKQFGPAVVGVTVAGVAGSAARNVARTAAEAAESFVDLVAEAKSELEDSGAAKTAAATPEKAITKVSVD